MPPTAYLFDAPSLALVFGRGIGAVVIRSSFGPEPRNA